jgi:hypothetical protein
VVPQAPLYNLGAEVLTPHNKHSFSKPKTTHLYQYADYRVILIMAGGISLGYPVKESEQL